MKLIGADANRYYAWTLEPGNYTVGRKSDCRLVITDSTVSRQHAELELNQDGVTCHLTDLSSHNGTYLNGKKVTSRVEVKSGDHIRFGQTEFKLTSKDDGASQSMPGVQAMLPESGPDTSVVLSMAEALKPLPARISDTPDLLPTLFDIARMLILPEPTEMMLERALRLVAKVVPAERLAVLFVDADQTKISTAASYVTGGSTHGDFSLSRTILNNLLSSRNAVLIADARQDPRFADQQSIILSNLKSAMAVPLLDEDKVLGILYAETANPIHRYNDDFLRLLATMGNIIASRLVNSTLLKEREAKQVIESELKRASLIQQNLLPSAIPEITGYSIVPFQEQCRAVGGDLYDVEKLPDGRVVFLIADVSGKGMGAALLMSNILASFRVLYHNQVFDPVAAVEHVSHLLYAHSPSESFATLFLGLVDPVSHTLTYVNAAHCPPLVVSASGTLRHLEPSGVMIGAFANMTWTSDSIPLTQGDLVVVFTDGVPEAGVEREEYSDERLERLVIDRRHLQPEELAQTIMADVEEFTEHMPHSDDITMLIIKRND